MSRRRVVSTSADEDARFAEGHPSRVSLVSRCRDIPCVQVVAFEPNNTNFWGHSREQAHFPAEQPASQPHPWLPSADAHPRRPQHHLGPPTSGPRPSGRLSRPSVLPARSRLRHPTDFRDTLRQGVRCGRTSLVVHARRTASGTSRAGFIVSKAVGNAVHRNRVKRRLRHLAAAALPDAPFDVDVVVRALPPAATADLGADFTSAFAACLDRLAA